jgi:hypothetical protein
MHGISNTKEVDRFTPRPNYPREKSPQRPLGGPQIWTARGREDKSSCPCQPRDLIRIRLNQPRKFDTTVLTRVITKGRNPKHRTYESIAYLPQHASPLGCYAVSTGNIPEDLNLQQCLCEVLNLVYRSSSLHPVSHAVLETKRCRNLLSHTCYICIHFNLQHAALITQQYMEMSSLHVKLFVCNFQLHM